MNLKQFIKEHRAEIDEYTQSQYKNDTERELFIFNDEYLYNLAKSKGVII